MTLELPRTTGVTLTSIVAKIYNALLLNGTEPEIEKILMQNLNGFHRNRSTTSQILTIHWILGIWAKNLEATLLFVDFSKVFDSIYRGKMEQILLAYSLPRETAAAIILFHKKHESKSTFTGWRHKLLWRCHKCAARGTLLAPYLFIIGLDNVLRISIDLMKENGFILEKARNRQYPTWTITDADYADDIALWANTPAKAESPLHSLEQATGNIGLHVNADKME